MGHTPPKLTIDLPKHQSDWPRYGYVLEIEIDDDAGYRFSRSHYKTARSAHAAKKVYEHKAHQLFPVAAISAEVLDADGEIVDDAYWR